MDIQNTISRMVQETNDHIRRPLGTHQGNHLKKERRVFGKCYFRDSEKTRDENPRLGRESIDPYLPIVDG